MSESIRDLVIVGGGPSALAAAIYTTREDIDTVIYEKSVVGGLAAITDKVDNYPGFPEGIEGLTLANNLEQQAERFGTNIEFGDVSAIQRVGDHIEITVDGSVVKARAVLIATGSDYKKIGVPGEQEFYARGVHYCATCDGAFYRERKLAVVGGGNSALQEAIFLTRFSSHIDLLVRSTIKASDILQQELQPFIDSGRVTVHLDATISEIQGQDGVVNKVQALRAGQPLELEVDGVFVFVGLDPNTKFLEGSNVELDSQGLVVTDDKLRTNIDGVFASGDVRSGATMQIASAVGEGASAALSIREYLDANK